MPYRPRWGLVRQRRSSFARPFGTARSVLSGFPALPSLASGPRSCLIGEALADDALQQRIGAIGIITSERDAVVTRETLPTLVEPMLRQSIGRKALQTSHNVTAI